MNIEESLLYLVTAKADCSAARKLHKSGFYAQSIFYTLQSVEKICKYFAIRNGLRTSEEVRQSIGHNSLKLFTKIMRDHFANLEEEWKQKNSGSSSDYTHFFKQIQTEIIAFDNIKALDLLEVSEQELDRLLIRLESLDKGEIIPTPLDYIFKDSKSLIKGLIDIGIINESELNNIGKEQLEKLHLELGKVLRHFPSYLNTIAKFILITSLLNNNVNSARYPDVKKMKTPNDIFHKRNKIVKRLPILLKHICSIIENFEKNNELKI